jgi:hypothetical protein
MPEIDARELRIAEMFLENIADSRTYEPTPEENEVQIEWLERCGIPVVEPRMAVSVLCAFGNFSDGALRCLPWAPNPESKGPKQHSLATLEFRHHYLTGDFMPYVPSNQDNGFDAWHMRVWRSSEDKYAMYVPYYLMRNATPEIIQSVARMTMLLPELRIVLNKGTSDKRVVALGNITMLGYGEKVQ